MIRGIYTWSIQWNLISHLSFSQRNSLQRDALGRIRLHRKLYSYIGIEIPEINIRITFLPCTETFAGVGVAGSGRGDIFF